MADHMNNPMKAGTLNFRMSGRLVFGAGAVRQLSDLIRKLGRQKILVITDMDR